MTGFGLRRVPMETHYYEAYNKPNVRLVDILEMPIECIKDDGVKTSKEHFKLDAIVYATGFSASKLTRPNPQYLLTSLQSLVLSKRSISVVTTIRFWSINGEKVLEPILDCVYNILL